MNETKDALKARLKKEGRWDNALLTYEEQLYAFKEEEGPKERFVQLSWEAVEKEYPPLPVEPEPEPQEEVEEEEYEFTGTGSLKDFFADAEWVYFNMDMGTNYTAPPPSSGALPMLRWARKKPDAFYERLMPRALEKLEKKPDSAEEAKKANLLHAKTLRERTSHLLDIP